MVRKIQWVLRAVLCAGKDYWKAKGNKGFKYKDRERTPDGLDSILLKSGASKRAKIIVKGKGAHLAFPSPLDIELPVTVQLRSANGEYWGSEFFPVGVRRNEPDSFKAMAGSPGGAFLDVTTGVVD